MATYESRKEYYKQWRSKNKDRIAKYNKQYWERKEKQWQEKGGERDGKTVAEYPRD